MPELPGVAGDGCGAGCAKYGDDGGAVPAGGVFWPLGAGADPEGADSEGAVSVGANPLGAGGPGCTGVQPTSNKASAKPPAKQRRPIRLIGSC